MDLQDGSKSQGAKAKGRKVEVTIGTYRNYFFNNKVNYILIPLTLLLFLLTQLLSTFFFKYLALYDQVKGGQDSQFETTKELWFFTGLILAGYFLFIFISTALIFLGVLLSNE